jgi:dolichyl-phosphate beta-glucosyltransferase
VREAQALAADDPRVVLQQEPHRGKGGAVRAGLLAARGARRFMCDADLSMPVRELPRFLAAVPARCDIAIGSREGAGARRVGEPGHRHTMGRAFNWLVRSSGLAGGQDTQCGFKMFTAEAVQAIFPWTRIEGWAMDIEVLYIAKIRGLRVEEIPIEWHYRDRSQVSPVADSLRMARDVARIRLNALRGLYRASRT